MISKPRWEGQLVAQAQELVGEHVDPMTGAPAAGELSKISPQIRKYKYINTNRQIQIHKYKDEDAG